MKRWGLWTTGIALGLVLGVLVELGTQDAEPAPMAVSGAATTSLPPLATTSPGPTPTVAAATEAPAWMHKLAPGEKPPQFVLFSFDGAASKAHWDRVLPIARKRGAHVTGLLSGVYLLADADADLYTGPGHPQGKSSIGFGGTRADVAARIRYLNDAIAAGHEIGTHYNGHFCENDEPSVGRWDTAQWDSELDQFFGLVDRARQQGLQLDPKAVRGGRTPCLEGDWAKAIPAMRDHGLTYDTSQVSLGVQWPQVKDGVWEFPMPEVRVPALGKQVVMMDYNLWYALDGADEKATGRTAEYTTVVLDTYRSVHQAALNGNRAPLVIGNHFNDWAGGAFSNAVDTFLDEVCAAKDTVCATYTEVIQWMQLQDPEVLDQFRHMPAAMN
ncbi:polysaccharide deacetylase [Actinosynnema sp. NPDC020468]|uniref:polysaccharide deacetylase n=1 Tax=Actinosynnema sp. NPDC020468 TaxID=3154488 RepID=UPI0033CDA293